MNMKSKDARAFYTAEINKATTINELVWIDTEYKPNTKLACDDLLALCRMSEAKKKSLKEAGQKYTRATRPAWR